MSIIDYVSHDSYFVEGDPRKSHSRELSDTSWASTDGSPVSEMGFDNSIDTSLLTLKMKTLDTHDYLSPVQSPSFQGLSPSFQGLSPSFQGLSPSFQGLKSPFLVAPKPSPTHNRSQSLSTATPNALKIRSPQTRDLFKINRHRTHNRSKSLEIATHTLQQMPLHTEISNDSMDLTDSNDAMSTFKFGAYMECEPISEESENDDLFVPIMTKELELLFETYADYRDLKCDQFNRSKMSTIKNTSDKLDYLMLLEKYIPRNRGILSDSAKSFVNLCLPIIHCFRMHHNSDKNEFMETFDKGISHTRFKFNHCNVLRRGYDYSHGCEAKKKRLNII
jgi:hypothetical protein